MALLLRHCPFCGEKPTAQPWHGGAPTKVMISCRGDDCDVQPMVTGETPRSAAIFWNHREESSTKSEVEVAR